jgi:large subunit ribosomal protein L24
MAQTMKIKKGDLVENLNMIKRHTRPRPMSNPSRMGAPQIQPGGVIEKAGPIQISNVMVVCPACRRPTRVGTIMREGKTGTVRVRVCKRADCGQEIDR